MSTVKQATSDRPAAMALIGIVILFIAIVGRGWQGLFSASPLLMSVFLGLVVAGIATSLAYATAAEPGRTAAACAYFFFLVNISALGTVNAAFVTFQAADILRQEIDKASNAVVKLRDLGHAALATPNYDNLTTEVTSRWQNLKAEIENPARCGQGQEAVRRATELQQVLPAFRMLSGNGQCTNNSNLIAAYEKQINDLLKSSPQYTKEKEKLGFRDDLNTEATGLLEEISAMQKQLSGDFSMSDVKAGLFDVSEKYNRLRQALETKSGRVLDAIPRKIDTSSASALGNIGQILPFILTRLTDLATYVYVAIAVLLDLAVIAAFKRVLKSGPNRRQRLAASAPMQL